MITSNEAIQKARELRTVGWNIPPGYDHSKHVCFSAAEMLESISSCLPSDQDAAQPAVQADVAPVQTCPDCGRDSEQGGWIDHAPYCRNAA